MVLHAEGRREFEGTRGTGKKRPLKQLNYLWTELLYRPKGHIKSQEGEKTKNEKTVEGEIDHQRVKTKENKKRESTASKDTKKEENRKRVRGGWKEKGLSFCQAPHGRGTKGRGGRKEER